MVDRWEYLVRYPYTVRHHLAAYFVESAEQVVDVGTYKVCLPTDVKTHRIDPLDTCGGFVGTVAEWWSAHADIDGFALVVLGMAVEGSDAEALALLEMSQKAHTVVVEWATQYKNPLVEPMALTGGKDIVASFKFDLPMVDSPGFPVFSQRMMVVACR